MEGTMSDYLSGKPDEVSRPRSEHVEVDELGTAKPSQSAIAPRRHKKPKLLTKSPNPDRGGFLFITGNTPKELKSKHTMTVIRKKAMASFLQEGVKSRDNSTSQRNISNRFSTAPKSVTEQTTKISGQLRDTSSDDIVSSGIEIGGLGLLADHDPEQPVDIRCICGATNDRRFLIPCDNCETWQHIACYYDRAQNLVDTHLCVQCDIRGLDPSGSSLFKRPADIGMTLDADSLTNKSRKRAKTIGAESSVLTGRGLTSYAGRTEQTAPSSVSKSVAASDFDRIKSDKQVAQSETNLSRPPAPESAEHGFGGDTSREETPVEGLETQASGHTRSTAYSSPNLDDLRDCAHFPSHLRHGAASDTRAFLKPILSKPWSYQQPHAQPTPMALTIENSSHGLSVVPNSVFVDAPYSAIAPSSAITNETHIQNAVDDTRSLSSCPSCGKQLWHPKDLPPICLGCKRSVTFEGSKSALYKGKGDSPAHKQHESDARAYFDSMTNMDLSDDDSYNFLEEFSRADGLSCDEDFPSSDHELDSQHGFGNAEAPCASHDIEPYILPHESATLDKAWTNVQKLLPAGWLWDVEYQEVHNGGAEHHGAWTCTPLEIAEPENYPLTIAGAPVIIPVAYQWPPMGGVNPPPDPRPSVPIDCLVELPLGTILDIFLTFEGSVGFYLLINGFLQIVVPQTFDTTWASSHLPHKYGSLKVCYIEQNVEPTTLPTTTETTRTGPSLLSPESSISSIFRPQRSGNASALKLNDFIEARPKSNHKKEKYAGRIGLNVAKDDEPFLVMSTHVITEAILAKSHRDHIRTIGRKYDNVKRLDSDWNSLVEIWAGNEKIGTIDKKFDTEADIYPVGFRHDVTLIKPTTPTAVKDITAPIADIGWLNRQSCLSLRQQPCSVKLLGSTEDHRKAKSIKCWRPSDILIVGEGIFLNQTAAAGVSRNLRDHDASTWKDLVSRALLYRVYPDFDPPNGYSGIALYAEGTREDGTWGPGIVGFQSFVQRSGHVQNFNMEGSALERRLQLGRVAFYGAFEVPEELKTYKIVS